MEIRQQIWHGLEDVPADLVASVVTIGVFDGVHRGHRTLIDRAIQRARELNVPSVLATFDPHPLSVVRPQNVPPMLSTVDDRARLAHELGINAVLAFRFTKEMAALSPEEFFSSVLVDTLKVKAVVVGENFTFGHKAAGTTDTLRELGERYGVEIDVLPLLNDGPQRVSSSEIRGLLNQGDLSKAAEALGRPYSVCGEIVRGAGRGGKELGYPTANQYFPDSVALPGDGVYAGWFEIVDAKGPTGDMQEGVAYPAAISIGTNPTFGDERRSVESFVLDRDADLYGRIARVTFVEKLRDMHKFHGVEELLDAIGADVEATRKALGA